MGKGVKVSWLKSLLPFSTSSSVQNLRCYGVTISDVEHGGVLVAIPSEDAGIATVLYIDAHLLTIEED